MFPIIDHADSVQLHTEVSRLEYILEQLIQSRIEALNEPKRRKKVQEVILTWFKVSYLFASLFLQVTKEGSSGSNFESLGDNIDAIFQSLGITLPWITSFYESTYSIITRISLIPNCLRGEYENERYR